MFGTLVFGSVMILMIWVTVKFYQQSRSYSFGEFLAYKVDHWLSENPHYKTYGLLVVTILAILWGGFLYYFAKLLHLYFNNINTDETFAQAIWRSWNFLVDNGAHLDEEGGLPVAISIILTLAGMLLNALLVGLVAEVLAAKMDGLRKGKSRVLERNHTLLLGWNDKILPLIREIAEANDSEGGGMVVILADRDKQEMELDIENYFSGEDLKGTQVVCRTGNPLLVSDLNKVSATHAKSIAVMAQETGDPDESDARAVRIVLALCKGLTISGHVVVELRDVDNSELIRLVGNDQVEIMVPHDIIGRLMIQCARQRNLAQTYMKLLGFFDNEFYVEKWPQIEGMPFSEVFRYFPDAIPCGVYRVEPSEGEERLLLNPEQNYIIQPQDSLLVLAEDNDSYTFDPNPIIFDQQYEKDLPPYAPSVTKPEKILFCGWRRDLDDMIVELEKTVPENSELHILSDIKENERMALLQQGGLTHSLKNLKLQHHYGNQVVRKCLESLPVEEFDSVLILADQSSDYDATYSDSRALSTLLLIRDIQAKRNKHGCTLISEILDSRTKQLVSVADISDYVVSNELLSMAIAMVLEQRYINDVLNELFTADGSEIFMRELRYFAVPGESLSFWELFQRASFKREIMIGYKRAGQDVVLNPCNKCEKIKWAITDVVIVIAVD